MTAALSCKFKNRKDREQRSICLAIDLMGSDSSPELLFEGVLQAAEKIKGQGTFRVLATSDIIDSLTGNKKFHRHLPITFHSVSDYIQMNDSVLAVRRKKESSLVQGMQLLCDKQVDGYLSAGSTAALIMAAKTYLKPFHEITRPALLTLFPTQLGPMVVIDVGGTVSPSPEHLVQYALMGIAFKSIHLNKKRPKVGLLNIGTEVKKGTEAIQKAYLLLKEMTKKSLELPFSFLGNVEGRDLFKGKVDVLVTDGFTGNIFLKTAEGISSFILEEIHKMGDYSHLLLQLKRQFDYAEYPGALVCGVDGLVVKCHGYSSAKAMQKAIEGTILYIQKNLIEKMKNKLEV